MHVLHPTTLVLVRGLVDGGAIKSSHNAPPHLAGVLVAALSERINGHTMPGVHQQTVSEAKEVWRYEENPN